MNESLSRALKKLRLSGMTQSLEVRLQEAAGNGLMLVNGWPRIRSSLRSCSTAAVTGISSTA